jgi:hypothetical protein
MRKRHITLIAVVAAVPIAVLVLRVPFARWQAERAWAASFSSHRKALEDIREALRSYRDTRGDWPASVDDLTALHPELLPYFTSSPPYELRLHGLLSDQDPNYLLVPDPRFNNQAGGQERFIGPGLGLYCSGDIALYKNPDS